MYAAMLYLSNPVLPYDVLTAHTLPLLLESMATEWQHACTLLGTLRITVEQA